MPSQTPTAPKRNVLAALLGMLGMSGIAGVLVAAMITPLIAVAGVAANSTITLFESLPDYLEITPLQQKTELYGRLGDGEVKFAEFYAQNRVEVPLDQMSEHVKDAVIATEDPRFYEHGGVDVISASRALLVSVLGDDGGGASTITMQFVRNQRVQAAEAILDPVERQTAYEQATEVTMGRKLQEMRLAIGVEKQYATDGDRKAGKDKILEGYLNIALFGGQVYGVESASQYYFGKPASDLTLPEAALIGGMVQNPNAFRIDDPDNLEAAKDRRDYVLRRMLEENKIDRTEYEEAVESEITPNITPTQHGCMNAKHNAEFFCDYVQNVMVNDPVFGSTYEERLFNFQTKGYQIHTTIDLEMQEYGTQVMNNTVPHSVDYMDFGTAMSMIEPSTGHVLTMVQNKRYDPTDAAATDPGATSVNFNTDTDYGGSAGFRPASTYKIFTLANWVQSGHSLNETLNARVRPFNMANFYDSCDGPWGGMWDLKNDANDPGGVVTALQATMTSLNTGFAAMAEQLDQCVTRDIAMAMGAHRADGETNWSNPSEMIGSGNNTIAPLSMANAIGTFANQGVHCTPVAITSITLRDGSEVTAPASECKEAISADVANASNYALQAVMTGGTGVASNPYLGPLIGKTGTTDNAEDTWMIASTTGVAIAIWVGNVEGKTSLYNVYFDAASGTSVRHVIGSQMLAYAIPRYGAEEWPAPDPSALVTPQETVPDVTGMSVEAATSALEAVGFVVEVGGQVRSDQPVGSVASTNPSANTRVPKGSVVTISTSRGDSGGGNQTQRPNEPGADEAVVPDVSGMTVEAAAAALGAAGFTGSYRTVPGNADQSAIVTSTSPGANDVAKKDVTFTLNVQ
ncbi:MAG: PASTA domain-containing protein [Microbacteriaceae bacterium]|nr:PASTA domain-containing protein [Microbacteriaceae bacterium]